MRILIFILLSFSAMAQLPSSGSLSIKSAAGVGRSISQQVDGSEVGNKSLTTLSLTATKTAPHSILEFYGYPAGPALPGTITGCSSLIQSDGIMLTWTNPSTGGTPEKTVVEESANGGAFYFVADVAYAGTSHLRPKASLIKGTSYTHRMRASNATGVGPDCGPTTAITWEPIPAPISPCSATLNAGVGINLAWTFGVIDSENGTPTNTNVDVSVNGGAFADLATIAYATNTYSHTGLIAENTYRYSFIAYNATGSATACLSNTVTYCVAAPNPVIEANASVVSNNVTISWTPDALGQAATQFKIERNPQSTGIWVFVGYGDTGNSYTDNAVPSDQYQYRVSAENSCGTSTALTTNSVIVP